MLTPQEIEAYNKKFNLKGGGLSPGSSTSQSYSDSLLRERDLTMSDVNRPSTKLSGGTFTLSDNIKSLFVNGAKGVANGAKELATDFVENPIDTVASVGRGAVEQGGHWLNESGKLLGKGIDFVSGGKTDAYKNYMNNFGSAADEVLSPGYQSPSEKRLAKEDPNYAFNTSKIASDIGGVTANVGLGLATGGVADKAVKGWQTASTLGKVGKFSTRLGLDATLQGAEGAIMSPEGDKTEAFLSNAIAGPALEGVLYLGGKAIGAAIDQGKYFKDWNEFGRDIARQNLVDKRLMTKVANDPKYFTEQVDKYAKNFTEEITTRAATIRAEHESGKSIEAILTEHPALIMTTRIENKGGALRWNTDDSVKYIDDVNRDLGAMKNEVLARMSDEGIDVKQFKGQVKQYIKQHPELFGGNIDDSTAKMMKYINTLSGEQGNKGFISWKNLEKIRKVSNDAAYAGSKSTNKQVMSQAEHAVYSIARKLLGKSPAGKTLQKIFDTQSDLLFMKQILGPKGAGVAGKPAAGGLFASGIDKLIGAMAGHAVGGFPGTFIGSHIGGSIGDLIREANLPVTAKENLIRNIMRYQYGPDWERKAIGDAGKQMIADLQVYDGQQSVRKAKEAIVNKTMPVDAKPASNDKQRWYQTNTVSSMDNSPEAAKQAMKASQLPASDVPVTDAEWNARVPNPEVRQGPKVTSEDKALSMDSLIPQSPGKITPPQPKSNLAPKVSSVDDVKVAGGAPKVSSVDNSSGTIQMFAGAPLLAIPEEDAQAIKAKLGFDPRMLALAGAVSTPAARKEILGYIKKLERELTKDTGSSILNRINKHELLNLISIAKDKLK